MLPSGRAAASGQFARLAARPLIRVKFVPESRAAIEVEAELDAPAKPGSFDGSEPDPAGVLGGLLPWAAGAAGPQPECIPKTSVRRAWKPRARLGSILRALSSH